MNENEKRQEGRRMEGETDKQEEGGEREGIEAATTAKQDLFGERSVFTCPVRGAGMKAAMVMNPPRLGLDR